MMRLSILKSVREAPSPTGAGCHQVYIYEYLPTDTQFPIEKWIISDYPIGQAREAFLIVGAYLAEQFSDPTDKGTPALTESDVEAVRQAVSRELKRKHSQ